MFWFELYQFAGNVIYKFNIPNCIAVPLLDFLEKLIPDKPA